MATASVSVQPSSWLRPKYVLGLFIGLMLAYVIVHNEAFLINAQDPEWQHIHPFRWWLLPHGLAGACALLLAPMQFWIACDAVTPSCIEWLAGSMWVAC